MSDPLGTDSGNSGGNAGGDRTGAKLDVNGSVIWEQNGVFIGVIG